MKAGWKTSEFWLPIVMVVAKKFFPDIPEESLYAVIAYIVARAGVKIKNGG